jgi:acetyl-CoA carboxylase alpha subunit
LEARSADKEKQLQEILRWFVKVPIITIIVGEGASGGALGIGWRPRFYVGNTWYSVISPESCSILWKSWEYKEQAAEAKIDFIRHEKQKLIDDIIPEPLGGHITIERHFQNGSAIYHE